ncbi:MAG: nitroreductase family protein [Cetobacterium sp.]|uniref:nitroreductase family protein n=1 Tax=unclassified Cetobacterium TaxID=2630983 RepID=UPI0006487278|nr:MULTISPECIES: nitroreductase family protein [unclassified Cetobacterium]
MNFKDVVSNRRSVNFFDQNKDLDLKLFKEIINEAVLAPSAFNLQPWQIIAVHSAEAKEKLFSACTQPKIKEAAMTLIMVGDTFGYGRDNPMWNAKIDLGMSEEKVNQLINMCETVLYPTEVKRNAMAVRDVSLFAMNIMLCAKNVGVDTHPMIGFNEDKVKELFEIDEDKTVVMLLSIGYFDETKTLNPRERRLQFDEICEIV